MLVASIFSFFHYVSKGYILIVVKIVIDKCVADLNHELKLTC